MEQVLKNLESCHSNKGDVITKCFSHRRLDEGKEEVEAGEAARLAGDVGVLPTDAGGNILDECLAGDWHGVLWRFSVLECWLHSAELV